MVYQKNRNKYHSKKLKIDGESFDSRKEYRRWTALKGMEKAGAISDLRRQVTFELIPPQREPDSKGARGGTKKGRVIERACNYVADFVYFRDGQMVVEDTKGFRTTDYIIKRKLMLWVHGIRILET